MSNSLHRGPQWGTGEFPLLGGLREIDEGGLRQQSISTYGSFVWGTCFAGDPTGYVKKGSGKWLFLGGASFGEHGADDPFPGALKKGDIFLWG